jgi:hypothetical protein
MLTMFRHALAWLGAPEVRKPQPLIMLALCAEYDGSDVPAGW